MSIDRILLRSVNWIGDAVLTTPAVRAVRRAFPAARVTMQCRPWVAPVYEANPDLDEVVCLDDKASRLAWLRAMRAMRRRRFDLGVLFPNSFGTALAMRLASVARRVGYARDGRAWLLTDRIPVTPEILAVHQVEYYLNLLRGLTDVGAADRRLVLSSTAAARDGIERLLASMGVAPGERLVGLNPGATFGTAKRWLPERFAEVADWLAAQGRKVAITGSAAEAEVGAEIAGRARVPIVDLAGKMKLGELIALMERLDLYVTNDSGAMHIAAAMGVPIVAIFGSTDWITTPPWSPRAIIVRRDTPCAPCLKRECPTDHRCMTAVTVEDVISAIRRHFAAAGPVERTDAMGGGAS